MDEYRGVNFPGGVPVYRGNVRWFESEPYEKYTFGSDRMPTTLVAPRFDYYASLKTAVDQVSLERLIDMKFGAKMREYMHELRERGYLGRSGGTVDPGAFSLYFPDLNVYYRWIPKNSCTSVKRALSRFEDDDKARHFREGVFHAEVRRAFGLRGGETFTPMREARRIAVIREPLERIVSCYIDKFAAPVMKGSSLENFAAGHLARAQRMLGVAHDEERSISFAEFVWYMSQTPVVSWDGHWKPQRAFFGNQDDVESYELFAIEDTAQIWTYLGLGHDNKRYNATTSGTLDLSARSEDYSELLPKELKSVDVKKYQNFLSDGMLRMLMPYFNGDYALYEHAMRQGRSRSGD